jgi:lactoylglutathione lyase
MVKDMKESLDFYQGIAGLEINRRFSPREGMEIVFLGKGETQIELIYNESAEGSSMGNGISLGFQTESMNQLMKLLEEKGIDIISGPFSPNPHMTYFFVLDPNGLRIQLIERK